MKTDFSRPDPMRFLGKEQSEGLLPDGVHGGDTFQLWLLLNGYPCLLPSLKGTINARFGILLDATNTISERIVQAIRDRIGRDHLVELEDQIKKGDMVQITSGPLKDLIGVFEKRMSGKDRVTILLNLIGVAVPVQISKYQIRKVA